MDADALRAALAPRYLVREVDEFVAIADAEGNHLARAPSALVPRPRQEGLHLQEEDCRQ